MLLLFIIKMVLVQIPSVLHAAVLGSVDREIQENVLQKILRFKKHNGPIFICSIKPNIFNLDQNVLTFTNIGDLPKPLPPNSMVILENISTSKSLKRLIKQQNVSCIYLCNTYRELPSDLSWSLNYAVLFQQSETDIAQFHSEQIFGMSSALFADLCEFVWDSPSSEKDYLVVDITKWIYMKNFRFSVRLPAHAQITPKKV